MSALLRRPRKRAVINALMIRPRSFSGAPPPPSPNNSDKLAIYVREAEKIFAEIGAQAYGRLSPERRKKFIALRTRLGLWENYNRDDK